MNFVCVYCMCAFFQAAIAIAFCLGFLFGPTIGAMFSILGTTSEAQSFSTFQYPALFSLCMAAGDVLLIYALLPETLPTNSRVSGVVVRVYRSLDNFYKSIRRIQHLLFKQIQTYSTQHFLHAFWNPTVSFLISVQKCVCCLCDVCRLSRWVMASSQLCS